MFCYAGWDGMAWWKRWDEKGRSTQHQPHQPHHEHRYTMIDGIIIDINYPHANFPMKRKEP